MRNKYIPKIQKSMFSEDEPVQWERKGDSWKAIYPDNEDSKREARNELIMLNAVKELIKDNDLACEVSINGITIGLCDNLSVLPAIEKNIQEINKFLKGEDNEWA